MSIIAEAIAPCSNCGAQNKITVYRSINVSENPEIKEKLKDGSLFIWECPKCGQKNLAKYETLYHDPEKKLMVWLLPEGDLPESQMQAIANHTKAMGDYVLRRVSDTGSLMEKILICESGLDDMVIEMCKYVTCLEIGNKAPDGADLSSMHFFKEEGEGVNASLIFIYPAAGQMNSLRIGFNVYEDCTGILQRNPQIIPNDPFPVIDQNWLQDVMK